MGRAYVYVIVGGGVAAGYAAHEFVKKGVAHGELCVISEETVSPYERPALSKGYLLPEAPARLPSFHCCVGTNEEKMTPQWFKEHGIELILGTRVKSADIRRKTLLTATGETISYKYLIVATGARALKIEEFGVRGIDAANVCYLRDLADADKLVDIMQSCSGGNAVVVGGGYVGMECAASLVINKFNVTMVFPEAHCMARLFTPKIASFYEDFYQSRGVKFIKGTILTSFEFDLDGKFYGDNSGEVVYFGDFSGTSFGAYWINKGILVGSFLEGGTKEQYEAIAEVTRLKPVVEDLAELGRKGVDFVMSFGSKPQPSSGKESGGCVVAEKPLFAWHATAGVLLAASIAGFAFWYGKKRRRW